LKKKVGGKMFYKPENLDTMKINNETHPQGYKMTELGVLPEEWEVVKFDSCIIKQNIKVEKIKKQEYKIYGRYPVIDQGQDLIAGYWDNEKDVYKKNLPVIIFGDHTRIIKYIDFPFVTGADGTKILVPNTSVAFPRFFYYSLLNLKIPSRGYNRHYSLLRESKIPLPPLDEQQKIAAVLSALQEAKEKTQEVIDATKALKKSMMKHLFTYGPVSLKEAENVPLKETEIGPMPEDWEVVKLGEVADISSGGNAPQGDKYFNGDKPFVRVSHIDNQNYSVNKYDLINDNAINDYRLKLFPKDTIIFPKSGATVYLEKRAMLPIDAYVVSHLCTVISNKEEAIQHFLFYVLISLKLAKEKADGYPTLNISEVKQIPIPLPPLDVQQKIASILSAIDEKIEAEENKKKALEELFKSLLHNLMTAKIRINQLELSS
jgi:type I restriction enzyme S subunit